MDSNYDSDVGETKIKLDIKNIALKAPKKSKSKMSENSLWKFFWINNIPKRECVAEIKREYSEVMQNMATN